MGCDIEVLADDGNLCGEAPTWDPERGRVIWTDIRKSLVYELVLATGEKRVISSGLPVAGIALNAHGRLVFGGAEGLVLWRGQDDYRTIFAERQGEKLRFNDILADPAGRVYAGSVNWSGGRMVKTGNLYLVDTDGSVRVVDEGIEHSNGIGLSPDNKTLYFADTVPRRIYAYDVDSASGALSNKRLFVRVPDDEGIPDGLTVDSEGYVWSAQWFGAQVVRYDPDGAVERRIELPVKQVSSVLFGGPDLMDLYVTSAAQFAALECRPTGFDETAPMGGALYRLRPGVAGKPEFSARMQWQ